MSNPEYQKKPTPKQKDYHRQCVWENYRGVRCKKKATGVFFCKQHFESASRIEAGSLGASDTRIVS